MEFEPRKLTSSSDVAPMQHRGSPTGFVSLGQNGTPLSLTQ